MCGGLWGFGLLNIGESGSSALWIPHTFFPFGFRGALCPEGKVEPLRVALGALCVAVDQELVPHSRFCLSVKLGLFSIKSVHAHVSNGLGDKF